MNLLEQIREAIHGLTRELALLRSLRLLATKEDLEQMENRIMKAIADFAAKQDAHNAAVDAGLTDIGRGIQTLKDDISALQNSTGTLSTEDQATLDRLEATAAGLETKVATVDALVPPAVPVVPSTP